MKIELRPAGHEWTWVVREGNVASLAGKRFSSVQDALRDPLRTGERPRA